MELQHFSILEPTRVGLTVQVLWLVVTMSLRRGQSVFARFGQARPPGRPNVFNCKHCQSSCSEGLASGCRHSASYRSFSCDRHAVSCQTRLRHSNSAHATYHCLLQLSLPSRYITSTLDCCAMTPEELDAMLRTMIGFGLPKACASPLMPNPARLGLLGVVVCVCL